MFRRLVLTLLPFLLLAWFLGEVAIAGMVIVSGPDDGHKIHESAPPSHRRPRRLRFQPVRLVSHRVKVVINDQAAQTEVEQAFHNPNQFAVEGEYVFPIPRGVAISSFDLFVDGKRVKGELLERSKARQVYLDYVRRKIDPGLLEYTDRGMIRLRLFPLPAGGERKVRLKYTQILQSDAGTMQYAYSLSPHRFSRSPVNEFVLTVEVRSEKGIRNVYSPSHSVDVFRKGDTHVTVSLERTNAKIEQDFLLYYSLSKDAVGLTVLTQKEDGEDGYFLALLSPSYAPKGRQSIPKDVTFVLDTSGSMKGEKLRQAKEALLFSLRSLNSADRFHLIRFSSDVEAFQKTLTTATPENVRAASGFISRLSARGGTNINDALLMALRSPDGNSGPRRPHMVIFLTDGRPTVGVKGMADILRNVRQANTANLRVFVFGVGYRVNTHLLDKVSGQNGGTSDYVVPGEDIEVKVSSFFRKVSEPVLANLSLDWGKLETKDVYPKTLPDLFKGSQIVLLGRYKAGAVEKVRLSGDVYGDRKTFEFEVRFPEKSTGSDFLPRLWATRKVGYLLDEIRLNGQSKELKDEVVRLAKKFGLMTPYTSFLAMEDEPRSLRSNLRPSPGGRRDRAAAPTPQAFHLRQKTGKGAVDMSRALQEQKKALRAPKVSRVGVRWVAGKVFRLKKGYWVDQAYTESRKTLSIRFASPEYFDLIRKEPKVLKFLTLGKKIIFCSKLKCYQIS
ncbi:MAG: VIT domain-containing protein [Nitrospinota bacterium]